MKKIDLFTNMYTVSKTLRFKLVPYGKTDEYFKQEVLDKDKVRAKLYDNVKKYIDEYHKFFIDKVLSEIKFFDVSEYADLYYKSNKTDDDKEKLKKESANLRKIISDSFTKHSDYEKIKKPTILIDKVLPKFLTDIKQIKEVEFFKSFGTYFEGFRENRENIYSADEKSTAVAYRSINDNLPKFLENIKSFERISAVLSNNIDESVKFLFKIENYKNVLTQKSIAEYNKVIGGYTLEGGTKKQGINELINLYNQTCEKSERLPLLVSLYKQILSDKESISFIPEKFENDNAVLGAVNDFYSTVYSNAIKPICELIRNIKSYDMGGIFVKNGFEITIISQRVSGDWSAVERAWGKEYDAIVLREKQPKNLSTYLKNKEKVWKSIDVFSIEDLEKYLGENEVVEYYNKTLQYNLEKIDECYARAISLLSIDYSTKTKRLAKTDEDIALIKNLLDSIKVFEKDVKGLYVNDVADRDSSFYGKFIKYYDELKEIDRLYDKVRNHITQKPYSDEKIKLTFDNAQLLGGWDKSKEIERLSVLLRRNGLYYLGIMNKSSKCDISMIGEPTDKFDIIEKMEYRQMASPVKDIPNLMVINGKTVRKTGRKDPDGVNRLLESLRDTYLPVNINEIRKSGSYKQEKDDLVEYIRYYSERVQEYCSDFQFNLKRPEEYNSYNEFLQDVSKCTYSIKFIELSYKALMEKVNSGELYLFQLYNKDFSEFSKGTPNLHTLYFKALFTEKNLNDVVYKLNGGAEMFYRFFKY